MSEQEPVLILAFQGWNDAGSAASETIDTLSALWGTEEAGFLSGEFYDLQVLRPTIAREEDGVRRLSWPGVEVFAGQMPSGRKVVLMTGDEPSYRWREFVACLLDEGTRLGCRTVVLLGALLADVPHTRDLPANATSSSPAMREAFGIKESEYEGPTGIVGVIETTAAAMGFSTLSLWTSVPHYVAEVPCPKATVALMRLLSSLLDEPISAPRIEEEADLWEDNVTAMMNDSPELTSYVMELERARDTAESPEATGEAIAAEFERYLRRNDN